MTSKIGGRTATTVVAAFEGECRHAPHNFSTSTVTTDVHLPLHSCFTCPQPCHTHLIILPSHMRWLKSASEKKSSHRRKTGQFYTTLLTNEQRTIFGWLQKNRDKVEIKKTDSLLLLILVGLGRSTHQNCRQSFAIGCVWKALFLFVGQFQTLSRIRMEKKMLEHV